MNPPRPVLLDGALVRRRRFDLGLSERAVGKALGVASSMIARIEDGTNHKDLPIGLVARLAEVLAVPLSALLLDQPPRTGGDTGIDAEPAGDDTGDALVADVARLGALLHATETPAAISAITAALGWTLEHTRRVIAALDVALVPAGLCVHHLRGEVRIQHRVDAHDPAAARAAAPPPGPTQPRSQRSASARRSHLRPLGSHEAVQPQPGRPGHGCATLASSTSTRTQPPATTCATAS